MLKDKKKGPFVNDESNGDLSEKKADAFAAQTLIPAKYDIRISSCRNRQEIILLDSFFPACLQMIVGQIELHQQMQPPLGQGGMVNFS